MADEIKQSDNIARVHPLNPSRNTGQRKRQRKPSTRDQEHAEQAPKHPKDGNPHRVDEYV